MVDVRHQTPAVARRRAEKDIPRLIAYWRELPDVAAQIDSWDNGEALTYIEEWRHFESKRYDIESFAAAGLLTSEQHEQLAELRELVRQHKPTLDQLLGR